MNNLVNDTLEILFNEKSNKFALWLNGKIVKISSRKQDVEKHATMLIDLGRVS